MPLTSQQFHEIIGSLRSDPSFGRRGAPRVGLRMRVWITPCVEAGPVRQFQAWLKDMSMSGMGFVGPVELAAKSFLVAQFPRELARPLAVLYKVMRCRRRGDHVFEVGARIERVLREEEIGGAA